MKKLLLLALTAMMMVGCKYQNPDGSYTTSNTLWAKTLVIDSCEYISAYNRLAHKGNCKYCTERRKQELKELVEQLKNK